MRKEPSEPKLPAFEMRKCELPPLSLFRVSLFGCLFLFILFLYFHHSSLLSPPFSFILRSRFLVSKHTRSLKSRLLFHLSFIILYYLSFSLSFVLLFHLSVNIISFLIYLFVLSFFYLISQLLSLFPFLFVFLTDLSSQGPGKTSLKTKTKTTIPWNLDLPSKVDSPFAPKKKDAIILLFLFLLPPFLPFHPVFLFLLFPPFLSLSLFPLGRTMIITFSIFNHSRTPTISTYFYSFLSLSDIFYSILYQTFSIPHSPFESSHSAQQRRTSEQARKRKNIYIHIYSYILQ